MKRVVPAVLLSLMLSACGSGDTNSPTTAVAPAAEPQKPAIPEHYYSLRDGFEYGYEQAVSESASKQGQVASKILMFKYLGERDGVLQFYSKDGDMLVVVQCERPCEFIKQMVFYDGSLQRKEMLRAAQGSIAWALSQDGMNGHLKKFQKERDGKLKEVWFDEQNGPQWRPVVAAN